MLQIRIKSLAGTRVEVGFLFYKEWSGKASCKDPSKGGAEESVSTPSKYLQEVLSKTIKCQTRLGTNNPFF